MDLGGCWHPAMWQEFVDAAVQMRGQAFENVA